MRHIINLLNKRVDGGYLSPRDDLELWNGLLALSHRYERTIYGNSQASTPDIKLDLVTKVIQHAKQEGVGAEAAIKNFKAAYPALRFHCMLSRAGLAPDNDDCPDPLIERAVYVAMSKGLEYEDAHQLWMKLYERRHGRKPVRAVTKFLHQYSRHRAIAKAILRNGVVLQKK